MNKKLLAATLTMAAAAASAELRITEICPSPAELDPNGRESGWVELYNDGDTAVNLADYELVRKNIGKVLKAGKKKKNLAKRSLAPGAYTIVYTSEEYDNAEDWGGDETVKVYDNDVMVYASKVSPKKFPVIALYKGTDSKELLQLERVPVDIQDGWSFCGRSIWRSPTKGVANAAADIAYGPNAGPLLGVDGVPSVFAPPARPRTGEDYAVRLPVNPLSDPFTGVETPIKSVTLRYHSGFNVASEKTAAMVKDGADDKSGQWWQAVIPADDIPAPGEMLRWRVTIEEEGGAKWTSPSFLNPDDGYQFFGSVVESPDLDDPKLQTFHFFVEGNSLYQMDVDADKQDKSLVPYNARCEVFDAQTGAFYDNVRIDLRGNTSGTFRKKSHGLKFAKCHPLTCNNPFDGSAVKEIRKTSFIAEYCDPAYIRQSLAFYTFRQAGCKVPFDYPVRLNLNGAFYQLAFHSIRFSDELIEDYYELDKHGWGYKNSGCLHWDGSRLVNWVTCEKKTPDDGDETSSAAYAPLREWVQSFNNGMQASVDDQAAVTKAVVKTFDLPAWLNYIAESKITMECDDTWANLSTYWDRYGTGTWMPLGYDMNQSWGHIYYNQYGGAKGQTYAVKDDHKAHPLFGGRRVLCYFAGGGRSHPGSENWAYEAIFQSTKFRRLYLRRLRSLMDTQLMPPGTPKSMTPFWRDYVVAITNATWECAKLDTAKWRYDNDWLNTPTACWSRRMTHAEGVADLWDNYIEPRRRHLYETHSAANTAWQTGYGEKLNAGIPAAQSSLAELAPKLSFAVTADGVMEIANEADETIDLSGWKLSGAVEWTIPAGTVADMHDKVYVVADRAAYIAANEASLTDQIIVGNAKFTGSDVVYVVPASVGNADGTVDLGDGGEVWFSGLGPLNGEWSAAGDLPMYISSENLSDRLLFDVDKAAVATSARSVVMDVVLRQDVSLAVSALPSAEALDSPQASLVLADDDAGATAIWLLAKDGWTRLTTPAISPIVGVAYALRVEADYVNRELRVWAREGDGWAPLSDGAGNVAFRLAGAARELNGVAFAGTGRIDALNGYGAATRPFSGPRFYLRLR